MDWRFFSVRTVLVASRNSSYSGLGSLTPGNRSEMIPSKRGTSGDRNCKINNQFDSVGEGLLN